MSQITLDLLRKSAEHNEGCIANLEEITLHQRELIKIEMLETYCRHLKILYLQNNIIEKMEGLNKLKELEYLNLALNNISMIENISGCESLRKLDLTVNFIDLEDLEESMINLSKLVNIRELFLTGNPCTDWEGYRQFVIASVPQLDSLDGKEIKKTEKIEAQQQYDNLLEDLLHKAEMRKIEKKKQEEQYKAQKEEEKRRNGGVSPPKDPEEKCPYTKEVRREMYYEQAQQKLEKEKKDNPDKFKEKKISPMYKSNGEIRQCNEGKYKFKLREWDDPDYTFFEIEIPKFLDTSLIDVNLNPKWVSVRVREKLTQLKFSDEILVDSSKTQRSQLTGIMTITCPKANPQEIIATQLKQERKEQELLKKEEERYKEEQRKKKEEQNQMIDKYEKKAQDQIIKQNKFLQTKDDVNFDDIPDLE